MSDETKSLIVFVDRAQERLQYPVLNPTMQNLLTSVAHSWVRCLGCKVQVRVPGGVVAVMCSNCAAKVLTKELMAPQAGISQPCNENSEEMLQKHSRLTRARLRAQALRT
jgi:hypothetical protein